MAQSSRIGAEALIPNPALKPLEFLVGEWRTTGSHPMVPGKILRGRTSFAWHEGGAFLIMRSEIDDPQFPSGLAIIGSDDVAGTFAMIYFDERGISRLLDDTALRAKLSAAAREHCHAHSWARTARRHADLYASLR